MEKDNDILKRVGKDPGFQVPEDYFDHFASDLMERLPEMPFEQEGPKQVTLWQKIRPVLYMAAMFAGISLMLKIFIPSETAPHGKDITALSEASDSVNNDDITLEDYIYCTSVNDYAVYEYLYDQYAAAE